MKNEKQDTCPNCGYCKHCGRGGHQVPHFPYPYYPYVYPQPWWGQTYCYPNITSGTLTVSTSGSAVTSGSGNV